ncbi:ribbon-helix-helix domain-containing protein [Clostridium hydrogenum]|uniref:ribbon-helix-helix domain-containing protein n=1 Tax=Clostridium hydrogenum TaxID=2855764 RepID=UPI001F2CBD3E|nr:hypothetical protein [Clostridium hydrogenum]
MERIHININKKLLDKIDSLGKAKNYNSRSDFFSKSGEFYIDYINNNESGEFLCKEVTAIMTGATELTEKRLGNRIAKLLSDIAIQVGILEQIMQSASDLSEYEISMYRKNVVNEIKNNQRILRYEDLTK